jgi:serine protease Do
MSDDFFENEQDNSEANIDTDRFDSSQPGEEVTGADTKHTDTDNTRYTSPFDKIGETTPAYSFWAEQISASANRQEDDAKQENIGYEPGNQDETIYSSNTQNHIFHMSDDTDKIQPKPKKKGLAGRAVKLVFGAAVFGLVAGGVFIGFNDIYYKLNPNAAPININIGGNGKNIWGLTPPKDEDKILSATTVSQNSIEPKTDVTNVIQETMPSIVTITTTYTQSYYDWFGQQSAQEAQGGGSGIIVGKNDTELLIATNNHVVEGADPITVKFADGNEAEAIIKGTDATADLAVISIKLADIDADTLKSIQIAKLGDSANVKVGEMAIAIGNALGYGQSTTVGYISAKDREVKLDDKTMVLLQTDAAINPGNSGGALLNLKGEVIGINTVKYASSEVEGMGFAIPISRAIPIIEELKNREILADNEKGYLGVYIRDVTEEVAEMYSWPIGVYVKETAPDGSAVNAGILAGDIITKVNDTEITATTQLQEKVTSYRIGTEITVTVMRSINGKFEEKQIKVTLSGYPETLETN